jgi:hypothetical protein
MRLVVISHQSLDDLSRVVHEVRTAPQPHHTAQPQPQPQPRAFRGLCQ